jgi:hypothetical protein
MHADSQLPCARGVSPRRVIQRMTISATAPETSRTDVKLAGSIAPSRNARRQRMEFPANASMATPVRKTARVVPSEAFIIVLVLLQQVPQQYL